jgi:hypothetical protein
VSGLRNPPVGDSAIAVPGSRGRAAASRLLPGAAILLVVLLSSVSVPGACPETAPVAVPGAPSLPYGPGETLRYKVVWDPPWYLLFLPQMEAGELQLSLGEATSYEHRPAARITFEARSSGTLASLTGLKVEDTFESLADPVTLCTYSVSKRVREGKRKRDIDVTYFPEAGRLHILETDVSKAPPQVNKDKFVDDIPSCVHDIFAAVYALRRADLYVGARHRWLLGDDDKVKTVETRVLRSEVIQGHTGPVRSFRIETVALLGGLFKNGGQFRIWLSEDSRRLPLRFEIQVKLGKAYGKLISVKP